MGYLPNSDGKTLLRADDLSHIVELYQVILDTGQYSSKLCPVQKEELIIECQLLHQSVVGPQTVHDPVGVCEPTTGVCEPFQHTWF